MGRIALAFRVFFSVLFSAESAGRVRLAVDSAANSAATAKPESAAPAVRPEKPVAAAAPPIATPKPPVSSGRSDALTLLETLQREARLIDFLKEPIQDYTDEQIGAAVRDIHRDSAKTLERLFGLRPVEERPEGSSLQVGSDAARYRLVGHVTGQPPYTGKLVHPGWQATRCEVPVWSGAEPASRILMPAEVEVG